MNTKRLFISLYFLLLYVTFGLAGACAYLVSAAINVHWTYVLGFVPCVLLMGVSGIACAECLVKAVAPAWSGRK